MNKTPIVAFRVTKAEKKRLIEVAKLEGKSLSSMLREAALSRSKTSAR